MITTGIAVKPTETQITVAELSAKKGLPVSKIQALMKKHDLSPLMLEKAIDISEQFGRSLHKCCSLIKEHDGDEEIVALVCDVCEEMSHISLTSVSHLLKKFQWESEERIIEVIEEACQVSTRTFGASVVLDLVHLAQSNDQIIYLDQLLDEFKKLRGDVEEGWKS